MNCRLANKDIRHELQSMDLIDPLQFIDTTAADSSLTCRDKCVLKHIHDYLKTLLYKGNGLRARFSVFFLQLFNQ